MTVEAGGNETYRAILVATEDADAVVKEIEEYGPLAVSNWNVPSGATVAVLGPVQGFTVVELPPEVDDYNALNLVSFLADHIASAGGKALGWYGAAGAPGPGLIAELDPNESGHLLRGLRASGQLFHADLTGPIPMLPTEVARTPQHSVPAPLSRLLDAHGVPQNLQSLGAVRHQLPLYRQVRLEGAPKPAGAAGKFSASELRRIESPPVTRGSWIIATLGLLIFGGFAVLSSFMIQPEFSDTVGLQIATAGVAAGSWLVTLQAIGVMIRGRPQQAVTFRLDEDGELTLSRIIFFWEKRTRVSVRDIAVARTQRITGPGTANAQPLMGASFQVLELLGHDGRRLGRIPGSSVPVHPKVLRAALELHNPNIKFEDKARRS